MSMVCRKQTARLGKLIVVLGEATAYTYLPSVEDAALLVGKADEAKVKVEVSLLA